MSECICDRWCWPIWFGTQHISCLCCDFCHYEWFAYKMLCMENDKIDLCRVIYANIFRWMKIDSVQVGSVCTVKVVYRSHSVYAGFVSIYRVELNTDFPTYTFRINRINIKSMTYYRWMWCLVCSKITYSLHGSGNLINMFVCLYECACMMWLAVIEWKGNNVGCTWNIRPCMFVAMRCVCT